jgi:hypothetical protein
MQWMNFRSLWVGVALFVALAGAVNVASAAVAAEKTKTGTIQQLNFGDGSMIVDGYRYDSTPEIRVEIAGSYGAFTMLQVGMKVQIVYRLVSGTQRDLVEITQIPDNFTIEEA